MKPNRRWVIINLADYTEDQLETLCQSAIEGISNNIRKSLDETKAILKWDGDTPSAFSSMTTYNHNQILTILNGSDWTQAEGE
tara:strand:- start:168 stop:416 length:249 start_codon:yes stop_codon:yes gene_type:complete